MAGSFMLESPQTPGSPQAIESLRTNVLAVSHGFFTRLGGVSEGVFASLNCSLSSPDDRAAVMENRARVARAIGVPPQRLMGLTQVHGPAVAIVTDPWPIGAGPQADAMVTGRAGIALGIITADCAPVLFADTEAGVIGAAHAGWRGALSGVLEATVAAMARLGAVPARIGAAVGPCIGQASYEVGADLRSAVVGRAAEDGRFFMPGQREGRWQFDLAGYCESRLRDAGLREIDVTGADTLAEPARFFSHRRRTLAGEGPIGHQISVIARA
jgi:polyphenol oxidase